MSDDPCEDLKDRCMNDAFWAADEIWRLRKFIDHRLGPEWRSMMREEKTDG